MFRAIGLGILAGTIALVAAAQDTQYPARGQQIPAPGYDRSGDVGFRCVRDAQ